MSKRWLIGFALVVVAATGLAAAVHWGRAGTFRVDEGGNGGEKVQDNSTTGLPVVVVDEEEFDFGDLTHEDQVSHVFRVFNKGTGPLKLQRGPTTCKCTMSTLPDQEIPPGTGAEIALTSKVVERSGFFSHGATIFTNDPKRPVINFRIIGAIRQPLAAQPNDITLSGNIAGQVFDVMVFSQTWDELNVIEVQSDLSGLRWEQLPPETKALQTARAVSGRRLRITMPADFSETELHDSLRITAVHPNRPEEKRETVVLLRGELRRDEIGLFGDKLYTGRVMRLGTLHRGQEVREHLMLKFRGLDRPIQIREVCVKPDFVKVNIVPFVPDKPESGFFRIEVVIPPDAPPCDFMGVRMGEVLIETDHPTRPTVKFQIEFSILSNPRF